MDYQQEYIDKNPDLNDSDIKDKIDAIDRVLSPTRMKFGAILDLACGSGKILLSLSSRCLSKRNTGVDISEKIINIARENDFENKVNWVVSDIFNLEPDNYELILAIDILEHVEDDLKLLNHAKTLGGFMVVKVPIEDNLVNKLVKLLSFRLVDEHRYTEDRYGHIHHYSEGGVMDLIDKSDWGLVSKVYLPLPKRSKLSWEILRIILFPIWYMSEPLYLKVNGGFLILALAARHD
ncbi:MAG: class I SAM-dependent methyltransferase [Patescibacteria group bacterium]|nr:class I SAM-dependent methyltransferase [Patescibacteria group bacterium]